MKKILLSLFLTASYFSSKAQLFSQNFTSSSAVSSYVSATPSSSQFTAIGSSNQTNNTTSITASALRFAKTGSGTGYFARNAVFAGPPNFVKVSFDFTLTGNTNVALSNNLATFFIGTTLGDGATDPANTAVHSKFAFSFNNSAGSFYVRKLTSGTNGPNSYTGKQTITFVINNSGSSKSYISPSGSTENIANDTWDLWVGTTKEFDDIVATAPTVDLSSFRFSYPNTSDNATLDFDNFVISELTTLPIQLTTFTGKAINQSILLNWNTASETNNDYYDIMRSADGKSFTSIGTIKGAGTTTSSKDYTFSDENPYAGTNYYQLAQHDFDGKTASSAIIPVDSKIDATKLRVYANVSSVKISISSPNKTKGLLHVFDITGRKLSESSIDVNKGFNNFDLPLTLISGVHFARYTFDNEVINQKFIK